MHDEFKVFAKVAQINDSFHTNKQDMFVKNMPLAVVV